MHIVSINIKPRDDSGVGIPKVPVSEIMVTKGGVGEDFNYYRYEAKDNTKRRAVLIIPRETLRDLREEGWPVEDGHLGENLTTEGFVHHDLKVGTVLRTGDVRIRITEECHPCRTLANLDYVGKGRVDEFISTLKGRRGWYAEVLTEGKLKVGDTIAFEE